jgi:hypothetical protein
MCDRIPQISAVLMRGIAVGISLGSLGKILMENLSSHVSDYRSAMRF